MSGYERSWTAWSTLGVPVAIVVVDLLLFSPGLLGSEAVFHPKELAIVGYATLAGLALTLRHRFPAPVFGVLIVHALLAGPLLRSQYIPTLTVLGALSAMATHFRPRWSLSALAVAVATVLSGVGPFLARYQDDTSSAASLTLALLVYVMFGGFAWGIGWWNAQRRERLADLARQELQASELEQARMTRAVMDERLRIASELHDIVASSVTVMVLQAAGGAKVIDRDPERARETLQHIESTGTEAMTELRRMLGVLRSSEGLESTPVERQEVGMRALEAALTTIERAGVAVTIRHVGEQRPLPEMLDLTVCRVVQESLTNTVKYAGRGATARVELRWTKDRLTVEVTDDGGGAVPELSPGMSSGAGLVGLRDRVTVLDGTLEAGPRPEGGFRVSATLPLGPAQRPTRRVGGMARLARSIASLTSFGS